MAAFFCFFAFAASLRKEKKFNKNVKGMLGIPEKNQPRLQKGLFRLYAKRLSRPKGGGAFLPPEIAFRPV